MVLFSLYVGYCCSLFILKKAAATYIEYITSWPRSSPGKDPPSNGCFNIRNIKAFIYWPNHSCATRAVLSVENEIVISSLWIITLKATTQALYSSIIYLKILQLTLVVVLASLCLCKLIYRRQRCGGLFFDNNCNHSLKYYCCSVH